METIIRAQQIRVTIIPETSAKSHTFWQQAETYRFGIIPMLLVIVACTGGIAAGFGAKDNVLKLGIIAFPTVITLALTLAVAPMRLITWSAIVAVLLQLAVLIF
jgi:hypothetical protein